MLLGGLWHGANWVFVAWGLFHGLLLGLEKFLGRRSVYNRLPRPLRVGMTFVLVLFSWVLFRSATMTNASGYFASMFGFMESTTSAMLLAAELYTPSHFIVMTICAAFVIQPTQSFDWVRDLSWPKVLLLLALFLSAIGQMFNQAFNPFLYFQF